MKNVAHTRGRAAAAHVVHGMEWRGGEKEVVILGGLITSTALNLFCRRLPGLGGHLR